MNNERYKRLGRVGMALLLFSPVCFAQNRAIEPDARGQIDAGNHAWVDGMKMGNAAQIAATYTEDAVDCTSRGECSRGRSSIEQHFKDQIRMLGPAQSASVTSIGAVQQGTFIYEWGHAEAAWGNGKKMVDRYLTAWRRDPDGRWRIFRNMAIPQD